VRAFTCRVFSSLHFPPVLLLLCCIVNQRRRIMAALSTIQFLFVAVIASSFVTVNSSSCGPYQKRSCEEDQVCCQNECYFASDCLYQNCYDDSDCQKDESYCDNECRNSEVCGYDNPCYSDSDCGSGMSCDDGTCYGDPDKKFDNFINIFMPIAVFVFFVVCAAACWSYFCPCCPCPCFRSEYERV